MGNWTAKDGALVGTGNFMFLQSKRTGLKDFHLRAECKLVSGQAALIVREQSPITLTAGYEVQLAHGQTGDLNTGSIMERHGRNAEGSVTGQGEPVTRSNEWFTLEVVVHNNRVETLVNGRAVAARVGIDKEFPSGTICLAAYHGMFEKPCEVHFRNLSLRELIPDPADTHWVALDYGGLLQGWECKNRTADLWTWGPEVVRSIKRRVGRESGDLVCTQRKVTGGDFELELQTRCDDETDTVGVVVGEYTVLVSPPAKAGTVIRDQGGRDEQLPSLPSAGGGAPSTPKAFNRLVVRWSGGRLTTRVNGIPRVEADLAGGRYDGTLKLRVLDATPNSGAPKGQVYFDNIQFRKLPQASTFVSLFNGRDLTGWTEFPAGRGSWTVKDGVLVGRGQPSHLFTERGDFANFRLRMEVRVSGGPKAGAVGVFGRVAVADPGVLLSPTATGQFFRAPVPRLYDDTRPPVEGRPVGRDHPLLFWAGDLSANFSSANDKVPAGEWLVWEVVQDNRLVSVRGDTRGGRLHFSRDFLTPEDAAGSSGHLALQLFDDWSEVEIRKIEFMELPAPPPAPKPAVLRRFDPAKDKPAPLWADAKPVTVEGGAWRIENDTDRGNFKVVLDTLLDDIPKTGLIVFRAKVKVKANDKLTWGSLQLGVGDPAFHKYDWPDHLGTYRGDVPEWTQKEVRYPAGVFHEKNPPSIPVYVGLNANGVVWVKDAEVLHIPERANPVPRPASKEPTKLRTFAPPTDTPTFGGNSDVKGVTVEDGGWRIESGTTGVKAFYATFGSIVNDIPSTGLIVLRMTVRAKANDKSSWGRILLNNTDPSFHEYDWPKHLGEYRGDVTEWTPKEIRIPAEVFHKKTPPTLTASADYSDGVLWVKDVEMWHVPVGAKLDVLKAVAPPDKR